MSYEIERATPCRVVVTATIGPEEVRSEREHVLGDWLRGARIDGFRKGKAPRALVEQRYAKEIRDDLEEHLTRREWDQVRREEKLRPASPLGIKESGWLESGEYRFKGEFDVYPTVTLPSLDGFTPPPVGIEPGDDEIAGAIEQLRDRQAAWEPVAGEPAAEGMLVEAEVNAEFPDGDGEPFHEERSLFQLGRSEVYPEIEAAVTGKAVGDTVETERTAGGEGGEERPRGAWPTRCGSRACGASACPRWTRRSPRRWGSRAGSRSCASASASACASAWRSAAATSGGRRW